MTIKRRSERFNRFILAFDQRGLLTERQIRVIEQLYWALRLNGYEPKCYPRQTKRDARNVTW
jgi:hypothetical protein